MLKVPRILPIVLLYLLMASCAGRSSDPTGTWRGRVRNNSGEEVAFTLEVSRDGGKVTGKLVNGDERTSSTAGSFDGGRLKLRFDYYDGELRATIDGDNLTGEFVRQWQKQMLRRPLKAVRGGAEKPSPASAGPNIGGNWVLRVGEAPNQRLWSASFSQQGSEVRGTIIPVTGDWGQFTGRFENDVLVLNRFDGINSRLFRARLEASGRLVGIVDLGLLDPVRKVVAERLDPANKTSVEGLPDPETYTRMANPAEPLRFSFTGLDGKVVSSTDTAFKGKVVVVSITGSWCPNCHEEAPLMQQFYEKYRAEGLEVVALAFEYTGDARRDLEQLRIFAARHKLTYPILLAGTTEEGDLQRKLPQLVNCGAYPTTIFIGRDGLVRKIHAGFEGRATGERNRKLVAEYENLIRDLLAGKESS